MILGIDEVGRGAWAGPLVVGAVVLGGEIEGLTDSKALTKKRREVLNEIILSQAAGVGLGWVEASEIDEIGLSAALKLATKRAVKNVKTEFHEIIIDGTTNFLADTPLESYVTNIKKADLLIPSVSAASIAAKVARDNYMAEQDEVYPGYNFAGHVGYGTTAHRLAIKKLGPTPLHRMSFAPLRQLAGEKPARVTGSETTSQTTRSVGDESEGAASAELERRGHEIIARNWKTKYCEIDIVSTKGGIYYFTEVKHRRSNFAGDGLAAITKKKLNQMKYSARFYAHVNKVAKSDLRLMAISTTGDQNISVEKVVIIDWDALI